MTKMVSSLSLSEAKARLSEVVRAARLQGDETVITVDGEPAARIVPMPVPPRTLNEAEIATWRVLLRTVLESDRVAGEFDAIELVGEGRR